MVRLEAWSYKQGTFQLRAQTYNTGFPAFDGSLCYIVMPVGYNSESRELETASGAKHILGKCAGNEEEQLKILLSDIEELVAARPKGN